MAAGIVVAIPWARGLVTNPFVPVAALLLFVIGGSFFGRVPRLSESLQPFVGKNVHMLLWGTDPPGHGGGRFVVDSVTAIGAGLHVYVRPHSQGPRIHIKIAQPQNSVVDLKTVEIGRAKYVQCDGRMLNRNSEAKAFVMEVVDVVR